MNNRNNILNPLFTGACAVELNSNDATGKRLYFPEVALLRNKLITSIQLYSVSNTQTPEGKNIVQISESNTPFLTLCDFDNIEFISKYPLTEILYTNKQLKINRPIVLQNCYIDLSAVIDWSDFSGDIFYFVFFYRDIEDKFTEPEQNILQSLEVECSGELQKKFYFPDNRVLVDKVFNNIHSYSSNFVGGMYSPSGYSVIDSSKVFLTIVYRQNKVIDRMPLLMLAQYDRDFKLRMKIRADLPSSYVEVSQNYNLPDNPCTLLTFQYC